MSEDDFEVIEPKDYTSQKDEKYSHSSLLMSALKKVRENRSKEMRDGYWNTKFDRMGNAHKVWIPDSRQEFIESVEGLMMVQERDYEEEPKKAIKELQEKLDKKYKDFVELEKKEWENLDWRLKQKWNSEGSYFRNGLLSEKHLPYYKLFIRDKLDTYTKIVSIIQQSIKDMGDYQEEIYEA